MLVASMIEVELAGAEVPRVGNSRLGDLSEDIAVLPAAKP